MALLPFKQEDKPVSELTGRVLALRQQGLDDHAIIERLQKEGHTATEIFDALREADAQQQPSWPDETPASPASNPFPQRETPPAALSSTTLQPQAPGASSLPPPPQPPSLTEAVPPATPSPSTPSSQPPLSPDALREQIDAIAETIIEEKWKELRMLVEKIIDWKQKVEGRILSLEREVNLLKEEVLTIQKSVLQRVEEYDQHIGDVMSEMKAMEKVFQKIIPTLTDNVTELRSIVEDLKKKPGKK